MGAIPVYCWKGTHPLCKQCASNSALDPKKHSCSMRRNCLIMKSLINQPREGWNEVFWFKPQLTRQLEREKLQKLISRSKVWRPVQRGNKRKRDTLPQHLKAGTIITISISIQGQITLLLISRKGQFF